jgi:hypothetical protein
MCRLSGVDDAGDRLNPRVEFDGEKLFYAHVLLGQ